MKNNDILKAWKNKEFRDSLSQEELASLPANPAGSISDKELSDISGGWGTFIEPGPGITSADPTTCNLCRVF